MFQVMSLYGQQVWSGYGSGDYRVSENDALPIGAVVVTMVVVGSVAEVGPAVQKPQVIGHPILIWSAAKPQAP